MGTNPSHGKSFEEGQVKAVFLFNLTKFVSWPKDTEKNHRNSFTIGVLGQDPFGPHLSNVVKNETVNGRPIVIKWFGSPKLINWQKLDLLFISNKYNETIKEFATTAAHHKVLTVGAMEQFCEAGGMINLLTVGSRVKLEVNLNQLKNSDLMISAQVLRLSKLVNTSEEADQ